MKMSGKKIDIHTERVREGERKLEYSGSNSSRVL